MCRIGLEAGPLSQWWHPGLVAAGRDTVLLEARHVKAALSAMTVKTDRKDARWIAQLLRMGWYRPVHAKSVASQDTSAVPVFGARADGCRQHMAIIGVRKLVRGMRLSAPRTQLFGKARSLAAICDRMLGPMSGLLANRLRVHSSMIVDDQRARNSPASTKRSRISLALKWIGDIGVEYDDKAIQYITQSASNSWPRHCSSVSAAQRS